MSICSVCGQNVSNFSGGIVKGKSGEWVCKECLKKAGIGTMKFSNTFITSNQIEDLINKRAALNTKSNSSNNKNKKPNAKIAIVLSIIVCIITVVSIVAVLSDTDFSDTESTPIEYIEISANDLYAAFEANEVAAEEKYKGKHVKVTGVVTEISSGGTFTQACILLNVEDSVIFGDVQCNFSNDDTAQKIAQLTKGQMVTITGLCSGLGTINLDINNCEIVGD